MAFTSTSKKLFITILSVAVLAGGGYYVTKKPIKTAAPVSVPVAVETIKPATKSEIAPPAAKESIKIDAKKHVVKVEKKHISKKVVATPHTKENHQPLMQQEDVNAKALREMAGGKL